MHPSAKGRRSRLVESPSAQWKAGTEGRKEVRLVDRVPWAGVCGPRLPGMPTHARLPKCVHSAGVGI